MSALGDSMLLWTICQNYDSFCDELEMVRPGPKPADVDTLKTLAGMFTRIFLHLRDGREGRIFRTERTAKTKLQDGRVIPLKDRRAQGGLDDGGIVDTGGETVAKIVPAKAPEGLSRDGQARFAAKARKLLSKITTDPAFEARRIWIDYPVFARQDLWEHLKNARSAEEMQRVAAAVARWMRGHHVHARWRRELQNHATDLFHAKETLWNYPRSDRPTSEHRRAEFFGKALAGLILGKSPATASRILSRWSPLKPPPPVPPPIRARGPNCPHCGATEVEGYPPGTVVRCPGCDQRYYIARGARQSQHPMKGKD
jgi:hypothetical protein